MSVKLFQRRGVLTLVVFIVLTSTVHPGRSVSY